MERRHLFKMYISQVCRLPQEPFDHTMACLYSFCWCIFYTDAKYEHNTKQVSDIFFFSNFQRKKCCLHLRGLALKHHFWLSYFTQCPFVTPIMVSLWKCCISDFTQEHFSNTLSDWFHTWSPIPFDQSAEVLMALWLINADWYWPDTLCRVPSFSW